MVTPENTVFYIGHVKSALPPRVVNYENLRQRLLNVLPELKSSTVSFKSFDNASALKKKFPFLNVRQVVHPYLIHPAGDALADGYGSMYENAPFPRWSGEIGLLLTVYKACVKLLDSDKEFLLWLEDDTTVSDNFETLFPFLCSLIDFDFDFIAMSILEYQSKFFDASPDVYDIGHEVYCKVYQLHWAGSVLISRRGAAKYISEIETHGFEYPLDWLIFNIRSDAASTTRFDSFTVQPWVFSPFGMNHDIHPESTIYPTHTFSSDDVV